MFTPNNNFGQMDQGYFVPRSEILSWVNDLLKLNLLKIEELGSGAVYCQILDAVHPGKISLTKVNWKAKVDYEFLNNYKILQSGFDKFNIKRYIDVQKLSKARYQDNLQFIQWLKRYYEVNATNKIDPYKAEQRRGNVKIDFSFAQKTVVPKNFNAGGQVIPKNRVGSKQKRSEAGNSAQKDSARRLASPNIHKKTISQEKREQLTQQPSKQLRKPQTAQVHMPPTPNRNKHEHKPQTSQEYIRPNRASIEQLEKYKKLVRDLQSKLEMIAQIAQTNDESDIKMKLIEEVLSIGPSKLSKINEPEITQSSPNPIKHIETTKTEEVEAIEAIEVIPESIHIHESLPQKPSNILEVEKEKEEQNMSQSRLVSDTEVVTETNKQSKQEEDVF